MDPKIKGVRPNLDGSVSFCGDDDCDDCTNMRPIAAADAPWSPERGPGVAFTDDYGGSLRLTEDEVLKAAQVVLAMRAARGA